MRFFEGTNVNQLNPIMAQTLAPMAPPQSVVHQIVRDQPLPAVDPLSPEIREHFERIARQDFDRQAILDRFNFPGAA